MKSTIYKIQNIVNNKLYIGQAQKFGPRKRQHFSNLRNNRHDNKHLQQSFNKHGEVNFTIIKMYNVIGTQEDIDNAEINEIQNIPVNLKYNVSSGGGAFMKGKNHSEETKKQMSLSRMGKKHSEASKTLMSKIKIGISAGEKHGRAKLTESQAYEIKFKHLPEKLLTQKQIGELYGVSRNAVVSIKNGDNWKHLKSLEVI